MKKKLRFFIIAFISLLSSCTEPIELDIDEITPRLVISGYLSTIPATYSVYVSASGGFFGEGALPFYDNADVCINTVALSLHPDGGGRYITAPDFFAEEGELYTLEVKVDFDGDGIKEVYTSEAICPETVNVEFLSLVSNRKVSTESLFPLTATINYIDPAGDNYYGAHLYITNTKDSSSLPIRYHYSDQLSSYALNSFAGSDTEATYAFFLAYFVRDTMVLSSDEEIIVFPLDTVELELNNHSEAYYTFLSQSKSSMSGGNPLFASPPGQVQGNISGDVLGAFGIYTHSSAKAVVPYDANTWTDEQMKNRFGVNWRTLFSEGVE